MTMEFGGEDFYKHFFCSFQSYPRRDQNKYKKAKTDADWTKYVKDDFLDDLAKDLGFDVTKREDIHGIDLTWERSSNKSFIAIEHENNIKTIWENEEKALPG